MQAVIADAAREVTATTILDLGTGTGETLRYVTKRHPTARLIGVDESSAMLAAARRLLPAADLRVARLQDPLPEGPFDLVVSALAVHHLDASEKADLFRRVAARLVLGGRFVFGDVIVPDDPGDVVTPIDGTYDRPSRADEQLQAYGRQLDCCAPIEATGPSRVDWRQSAALIRFAERVSQFWRGADGRVWRSGLTGDPKAP